MSGKASRGRPARRVKPLRSAKMGVSTRTRRAKQGAGNSAGGGVPFDPAISPPTPSTFTRPHSSNGVGNGNGMYKRKSFQDTEALPILAKSPRYSGVQTVTTGGDPLRPEHSENGNGNGNGRPRRPHAPHTAPRKAPSHRGRMLEPAKWSERTAELLGPTLGATPGPLPAPNTDRPIRRSPRRSSANSQVSTASRRSAASASGMRRGSPSKRRMKGSHRLHAAHSSRYVVYGKKPPKKKTKPPPQVDIVAQVSNMNSAATDIQRVYRGQQGRLKAWAARDARHRDEAARAIQRVARGGLARNHVGRLRGGIHDPRVKRARNAAATRIQAVGRGYLGRQRAAEARVVAAHRAAAATKIQAMARGHAARRYCEARRIAGVQLQAFARGVAARKEVARRRAKVVAIQSAARARAARRRVEEMRRQQAARRIQRAAIGFILLQRGRQSRARAKAALRLQAQARAWAAQRIVAAMRLRRAQAGKFIQHTMERNGIGASVDAQAAALRAELGYSEDDANQTATNLHEAQVALMANVAQDDIRAFLQGVVSPSRVLVALAGAVCVVFGHEPQWNAAMRILLAPDFYDVAMALTPDMLHQDRRRTLRQLFHQHRLLHTATLTGNEVIFLLARWVGAMVGLLNDHIPEEHLPEPQRTISRHNSAVSAAGSVRSTESRRSGASASNSVRMRGAVGRAQAAAGVEPSAAAMQGWPQTKSGRDVRLASRRGEDMTASAAPGVDVAGAMAALETARLGISELPAPHVQELYEVAKPDKNLAACAAAVCVLCNKAASWASAKAVMARPDFRDIVVAVDPAQVTDRQLHIALNLQRQRGLRAVQSDDLRPGLRAMARWMTCLVDAAQAHAHAHRAASVQALNTRPVAQAVAAPSDRTMSLHGSPMHGDVTRVTGDSPELQFARRMVSANVSAAELLPITAEDTPGLPVALTSAMMCLLHDVSPATWQNSRRFMAKRTFTVDTVALDPSAISDEAKSLVREMFAEHAAWDKVTDAEEDRAIRALMRWAGVISGYAPLVEITRAALIAARQRH